MSEETAAERPVSADGGDLSVRDRAAVLLASGRTTDSVGVAVGVDGRTVRKWRADSAEFRARIEEARRLMFDAAAGRAADGAVAAVDTLLSLALDEGEDAPVRARAAVAVLDQAVKLRSSVELEQRMAELESVVAKVAGGG